MHKRLFTSASSRRHRRLAFAGRLAAALCLLAADLAAAQSAELGRLFFTPAQRAQLEAARARASSGAGVRTTAPPSEAPAPVRYDGVVIRSDGKTTRWVDGAAQLDGAGLSGLKPGQIRADGKVYEPYQVLRPLTPLPPAPAEKESAP
jgi:hypothetical protein